MNPDGPVDPSESILRRIPKNSNSYDPTLPTSIVAFAFRPTDNDIDRDFDVSRALCFTRRSGQFR